MSNPFFDHPILNSPYEYPLRHWETDKDGQPTQKIIESRRRVDFITPIPKPKKQSSSSGQSDLTFKDEKGLSDDTQQYDQTSLINEIRNNVDSWRLLPETQWQVTSTTAMLLKHWRHHRFSGKRPFFCQVEAIETIIWLTEVAPHSITGKRLLGNLEAANKEANPGLMRLALKLATGAGKTTVMAMIIAWQTINAVRRPGSKLFTRGFLVITPGITIKDRLQVLQPNDPYNYYTKLELVPVDMLDAVNRAKIVITNFHALNFRETLDISKGGRRLLQGRRGDEISTLETDGKMIQRVMPDLLGMKNIMVINDEAHHCYREKPADEAIEKLTADEKKEADRNNEAARVWISGIEAVKRTIGLNRVVDLSATPFFLRGSGYPEGVLFGWTACDFSLMDAIECGIVKLPRVPIADNVPGHEMPMFRDLWRHIRTRMPKKGRGKSDALDPASLPPQLQTALEALYGHYEKTFRLWQDAKMSVPPCFIIICNNTSASKLVYDFVSGYKRKNDDGTSTLVNGRFDLFRNFDEYGNPLPRPSTLLIDSEQLESDEALDDNFREMASDEIERFRREIVERTGNIKEAENLTDQKLLREVMNTVGKPNRLGANIRCVVSVSMLTEGWDAKTVTHVLGVRAFGTQLLCEQVVGRALRRQSYELNAEGLFDVEYADVLGIPFNFNAEPVVAPPQKPRETIQVKAVSPERDALEIRFPRVEGYRVEVPDDRLNVAFDEDSKLVLTPELVGATETRNSGIIGVSVDLNLVHTGDVRPAQVLYELTSHLVLHKWKDEGQDPKLNLFGQFKRITREWLDKYLVCKGGTYPAQLKYKMLADMACDKIAAGINRALIDERPIKAVLDPYNPIGSTAHVNFATSRESRWETDSKRCHVNWVVLDSDWEAEFCRIAEENPGVISYVKNHGLGFEVPYRYGSESRKYFPDFIVLVDDGYGVDDPLHLIVEIKGYRGEDAAVKKTTMDTYWIPGVNNLGAYGRWAFAELTDVFTMEVEFALKLDQSITNIKP